MDTEMITETKMVFTLLFGGFLVLFLRILDASILKPRRLRSKLEKQGLRGPAPSLLYGNIPEMKRIVPMVKNQAEPEEISHDWFPTVFPHLELRKNEYGPTFLYSTGNIQMLCVTDPEMVKELSVCTLLNLGKPLYLSTERGPLLGRGILSSNGPYWAHQRKIIAPEFYLDKVKGMVKLMVESTLTMLKAWETKTGSWEGKVEIRVDEDLRSIGRYNFKSLLRKKLYTGGEDIQ